MKIERVRELEDQDLAEVLRIANTPPLTHGAKDIVDAVMGGRMTAWRMSGDASGLVLTRILSHPAGKELNIWAVSGKNVLKCRRKIRDWFLGFAHTCGIRWVTMQAGTAKHEEAYSRLFLDEDRPMTFFMMETPKASQDFEGVELGQMVQLANGGEKVLGQVEVGDLLRGRNGSQKVVAAERKLVDRLFDGKFAAKTKIWGDDDAWVRADQIGKEEVGVRTVLELTVEPDHEYFLSDGTLVHNKGGGGGGGGGDQNVETTTIPWEGAQPYIRNLYASAQDAWGRSTPYSVPGTTYPGLHPTQRRGFREQRQTANQIAGFADPLEELARAMLSGQWLQPQGLDPLSYIGRKELGGKFLTPNRDMTGQVTDRTLAGKYLLPTRDLFRENAGRGVRDTRRTIAGDYLDPANNPTLNAYIDAANRPIIEQFNEQIIPGIGSAAVQGGAYGGSRQAILEGLASEGLAESMTDTANRIYNQEYGRERGFQREASNLQDEYNRNAALLFDEFLRQNYMTERGRQDTAAQAGDAFNRQNYLVERGRQHETAGALDQFNRDTYAREREMMGTLPGQLFGLAAGFNQLPGSVLSSWGDTLQADQIARRTGQLDAYQRQQDELWSNLGAWSNVLHGGPFVQTSREASSGGGGLGGAIQGGIGGLSTAATLGALGSKMSMPMLASLGGPWGLAGGAILGGLAGFL